MKILCLTVRIRAEWCLSLKDKRMEVRKLLSGLRNRFNVSACESGEQDIHTLIELTACALAFDSAQMDSIAQNLMDYIEETTDGEILSVDREEK